LTGNIAWRYIVGMNKRAPQFRCYGVPPVSGCDATLADTLGASLALSRVLAEVRDLEADAAAGKLTAESVATWAETLAANLRDELENPTDYR
jgi:TorA maturation chaperone TorD